MIEDLVFIWIFINGVSSIFHITKYPMKGIDKASFFERFSLAMALVCGYWLFWLFAKVFRFKKKNFMQEWIDG